MKNCGMTLLEVLAAIVLLSLLITTLAPMQSRWRQRLRDDEQRFRAEAVLVQLVIDPKSIDAWRGKNPEWNIEIGSLRNPATRQPGRTGGYRWTFFRIRDAANNQIFAQTFAVESDAP